MSHDLKHWFIYVVDRHEGPFTPEEILQGIASSRFSKDSFLWKEGMADWQSIHTLEEFKAKPTPSPVTPAIYTETSSVPIESKPSESKPFEQAQIKPVQEEPKKSRSSFKLIALMVLAVLGIALGLKPFLSRFGGIPELVDVDPADFELLKIASKHTQQDGVKVEVVSSKDDPISPSLYVAGNLPEGTLLNLKIDGIPETLLNITEFSQQSQVMIKEFHAKTPPIRYPDGRAIPRGEYWITLTEELKGQPQQLIQFLSTLPLVPGTQNRIYYRKRIFFGQKDQTYLQRLKEFHDKLNLKARSEVEDLKQFGSTLQSQFESLTELWSKVHKSKKTAKDLKLWTDNQEPWLGIVKQIETGLSAKLTPDALKEFLYPTPFQELIPLVKGLLNFYETLNPLSQQKEIEASQLQKIEEQKLQLESQLKLFNQAVLVTEKKVLETIPGSLPPAYNP